MMRWCTSKKKKLAASGPDGVSRADLLALSDQEWVTLASLFRRAMTDGAWPLQLLEGSVRCLAKKVDAQGVSDYRPVTIYSIVYRVWSSLAARHWMHHLEPIFDGCLFGSRSGKRASQVWRAVLDEVEGAHQGFPAVGGICFDLHAAFNLLPRCPVFGFAKCAGVDDPTITAWSSFLTNQVRRFQLHGQVSGPTASSCGFPEGCALSCLSMALTDQILHLWLHFATPSVKCFTYVDDWEVMASSAACLSRALRATQEFANLLDLCLDPKKSYAWGTNRPFRQTLKPLAVPLVLDSRVLGAHVAYSQQVRNATIQHQLSLLSDFWQKLSASYGSYAQKCAAVRVSAWPRVLHSVSATVLGLKHFVQLRSDLMSALGYQKPGASPFVHLLLDFGFLDPQLFAVVSTFRDHRALFGSPLQRDQLGACASSAVGSRSSVSAVLVQRLHQVGWSVADSGWVTDGYGSFDLQTVSWQEVELRLRWSWKKVVAQAVLHRSPFAGFVRVDLDFTKKLLFAMNPSDQGVFRRILNGSQQSNSESWRWSKSGTLACRFCGAVDTIWHRYWTCPHTSDLRASLPAGLLDLLPSLPLVLTQHGWTLESSVVHNWRSHLLSLPSKVQSMVVLPSDPGCVLDFFTDGSVLWPGFPTFRLASWSVILAGQVSLTSSVRDATLVAAGVLPGLLQIPFRAELFALGAVLALAVDHGCMGMIRVWSDCQAVVLRCRGLLSGQWRVTPAHPHADLWDWVWRNIQVLGSDRVVVNKVQAHCDIQKITNDVDRWCAVRNLCADEAARVANVGRPAATWELWTRHAAETTENRHVGELIARHQVACQQRWFRDVSTPVVIADYVPRQGREFPMKWIPPAEPLDGARFVRAFSRDLLAKLDSWWQTVFVPGGGDLQWIAFSQLFLHWVLFTGHPGVVKHGKQWLDGGTRLANPCSSFNFRTRSKWFRLMIQEYGKSRGWDFACATLRPRSEYMTCHVGCVSAPMVPGEWEHVETWLRGRVLHPIKLPKQLDTLQV